MKLVVMIENKGKEYTYTVDFIKEIGHYYSSDIAQEAERLSHKAFTDAFMEEVFGVPSKTAIEAETENDENIEEFDKK